MTDNPNIYNATVELKLTIPLHVAAKLSTYRRQEKPEMTDAEAAAYLLEDYLVSLGMWNDEDKAAAEGRGPRAGWRK